MQITYNLAPNETCANILRNLQQQGISAIPLNGKRPSFAIKWKQYQHSIPSLATVDSWSYQSFNSYGIICGQVSHGIIVFDFDCPELYKKFINVFSELTKTYTVKTKRGYHIYLQSDIPIPSRQFKNCDIKGDGGYVVGANSCVDGYQYTTSLNTDIAKLTYKTYRKIVDWLSPQSQQYDNLFSPQKCSSQFDMISQYNQRLTTGGRNNALFVTVLEACQHGVSIQQVIQKLATYHAITPPTDNHKPETIEQRLKEAIQTIHSAYRYDGSTQQTYENRLSNSIREALLKVQQSTITARLLDAIIMLCPSKKWLTLKQLIQIGRQVHIGKKSILRVLTGDLAKVNGKRLFKQTRYHEYIYSYASQGDKETPNCKVGRPTQFIYQIPTVDDLCQLLDVKAGVADKLQRQDLFSAGAYRRALHRELIRRMSPMIRVAWYADRLGVTRRTIFRYNIQIGVIATPMIQKEQLTPMNTRELPTNDQLSTKGFTPGIWLETSRGKRYPAIQPIANMLENISSVNICRQLPTRYTLPDTMSQHGNGVELPEHLKSRGHLLTYSTVHALLPPDWATEKYGLGGYLAVYNGYEWTFRPPLRAIAYQLVKQYEDGLVYFIQPIKT